MERSERLLTELDAAIAARHILGHPFYQAWTEGRLTAEGMRDYARQYYRQVEAFPAYLGGVYARCRHLASRRMVLENIIEEDRGEENHPELWLRFAEGVGAPREEVLAADPLPETAAAVATFRELTVEGSAAAGMAALYAYEAMVPEVAEVKIASLKRHYGIDDPRTLQFFEVHREADQVHREWDREILAAEVASDAEAEVALDATRRALDAMWTLLDGVHRRHPTA